MRCALDFVGALVNVSEALCSAQATLAEQGQQIQIAQTRLQVAQANIAVLQEQAEATEAERQEAEARRLSADLAAICGKTKMSRPEMTKALWGYIKKNKLNKGRTITPDAKLKKVLPSNSSAGCAFRTDCML